MSYDAKKAAYQEVTILGRPALFAECRIDNSTVPKGLYRYELRHGDENWGDPVSLSRNIIVNYYGAVLTREPFQLPIEGWIPLEDDSLSFQDGGCRTLAEFQRKYPVSKKDVIDFFVANDDSLHDFYFSHSEAQDKATGCVGHLRGDFGSGKQFFTTWWPHQGDQLNTPAFKADIDRAVNWLREQPDSPLHDFDTMKRFCGRFERSCAIKGAMLPSYAFMAKTKQYVYMIRCTPVKGDYVNAWGADYGDPQNFLGQETYGDDNAWYSTAYSKANNITDPELLAVYQKFTAMVEKASNTTDDMDARYEAYADAEAYMLDKVITLPLYKVVSWEMTHVNDYSKIYAPYGIQINKFKNWETSVDLYTTEDYAKLAAIYEANAAK